MGSVDNPIDCLYGVSFRLVYNSQWLELIQPLEMAVQAGDFLGNLSDIQILPPQIHGDALATAITRTDTSSSANGFGILLQIGFQSKKSTPNSTQVCFSIFDIVATDSAWNPINLQPEPFCIIIERPYGIRPNPFTPNEDGFNDQVEFNLPELIETGGVIRIFDLWGKKVRQIEQGWLWNGTDEKGNDLPPGTYLYVIESQGNLITKGTLGLVR
ncbi:gliding motility-associated C-terminal domain-containing protein [candidate division KSB1 bacterium]|nr:gliding motility-associated C-terminal domain-containing protein [candidate division KSB1 bacterium]